MTREETAGEILRIMPWPGPEEPWAHQRVTAAFCLVFPRCAVLHSMGSGKTLSAAWAAHVLIRSKAVGRVLIVAPISIAAHVWQRQMRTLGLRTVNLCSQTAQTKRAALADRRHQVIILNPDGLKPVERQLTGAELVIVDEATAFKTPNAQRSRCLRRIATKRVWLMTGTPTPNSPLDALGLIKILDPACPYNMGTWRDATMHQITRFKWTPRKDAQATVARHLVPSIRFPREQCFDVPDVQEQWLPFDLSPDQAKLARHFREHAMAEFAGQTLTAVNAAVLASKLLQIECGVVYHTMKGERETLAVGAPDFLAQVESFVHEADTPVLIFASFRSVAEGLHRHLGAGAGLIHGGTPHAERTRLFDAVQAGTLKALVALPDCVAHGVTLTAARYVLWATPTLRNEFYEQANARIVRPGQVNKCIIAHLYGSKQSKTFYEALKSKGSLQNAVLKLMEV